MTEHALITICILESDGHVTVTALMSIPKPPGEKKAAQAGGESLIGAAGGGDGDGDGGGGGGGIASGGGELEGGEAFDFAILYKRNTAETTSRVRHGVSPRPAAEPLLVAEERAVSPSASGLHGVLCLARGACSRCAGVQKGVGVCARGERRRAAA